MVSYSLYISIRACVSKHGKRIIIKGRNYVNNPENKFTVTVLGAVAELERVAGELRALDEERRRLIDRHAAEEMAGEAYITANRALDRDLERLTREKAELTEALRSPLH